jgi:hypothetical protein
MAAIPEAHDATACPGCQTGHPCRVSRLGTNRQWALYRDKPRVWGPILAREALADAAGSPSGPPPKPAASRPAPFDGARRKALVALVNACPHRGCRRSCQKTRCERDGRDVYLSDCIACVEARPEAPRSHQ